MDNVELDYLTVANDILHNGIKQPGRNGVTKRLPFQTLDFNISKNFPLLTSRKIFYTGALGEYAAFIRQPKHIDRFKFGWNRASHYGIKEITDRACMSENNRFPTNDGQRNFDFLNFVFGFLDKFAFIYMVFISFCIFPLVFL